MAYQPAAVNRARDPLFVLLYGLGDQILEPPLHDVGQSLAYLGMESVAPMLRSSGFRGPLTRPISEATKDIVDWINDRRADESERPVVFVTFRESLVWALETLRTRELTGVAGIVAISPPPDLPRYAQRALGQARYEAVVASALALAETPANATEYLVEKYLRPPPATPGSTDVFMQYPAAFLEYYGPEADTYVSRTLSRLDLPVLIVVAGEEDELATEDLQRLLRAKRAELVELDDTGPRFAGREHELAKEIADWVQGATNGE